MTDLMTLRTDERTIEILHPGNGEPVGIRVKIVHVDDERLAKIKRAITDKRLYLEARAKVFKADEIEENKLNLLFAAMVDWTWYNPTGEKGDKGFNPDAAPTFNGEGAPQFDRKTVGEVLKKLPWFSDQINEAVGDTKSFF